MATTFKYSAFTGPVFVYQLVEKFKEAGFIYTQAGTEKLYGTLVSMEETPEAFVRSMKYALARKHGTSFGLNIIATKVED